MTLAGGLVVEGTLVVEAGTELHADGAVVLASTMELEIVLLNPDTLEDGTVQVIACMSFFIRVCVFLFCIKCLIE